MPGGAARALLALGLLALGCGAARPPPPGANDFPDGAAERRRHQQQPAAAGCPRDCGCSQEGVVDCGGIDLKEFPLRLPELTNHLSLQNNQIEEIFPEELARLHRLETLNLQNNRLTSKGKLEKSGVRRAIASAPIPTATPADAVSPVTAAKESCEERWVDLTGTVGYKHQSFGHYTDHGGTLSSET